MDNGSPPTPSTRQLFSIPIASSTMSRFLGEGSWIKSVTTNSKLFCDPSMIAVCTASVVTAVFLFHVHLTRNPTIEHSMHTNHQKSIRIVDENDDKGKTTGSKRGLSRSLSK